MADQAQALQQRLIDAIAINSTYIALASPTVAQNTAQLKALTRQVQAILRLAQDNRAVAD
jgi:uncharacterized coiled-coil protein SlyX